MFLRKRRAAVTAASAGSTSDIIHAATVAGAATWSAAHQAQEMKLNVKRDLTKISGDHIDLPQDGVDADLRAQSLTARAKAHAAREKAKAKTKALRSTISKPRKPWPMAKMPVYTCDSLSAADLGACRQAIAASWMLDSRRPMDAVYHVTTKPGGPVPLRTKLVTGLCGGMLVTPVWLTSKGSRGLAVMAVPAIHVKRKLWISTRFRRENPSLARTIDSAMALPRSRWAACSKEAFADAAIRKPVPLNVLALVTRTEKAGIEPRSAMDLEGFLTFIYKLDPTKGSMGTD